VMRLNGWQRIGVIASAVWGIAGWLIGNSIGLHGGDLAESEFADCIASPITTGDACLAHFRTAYAAGIDGHWLTAAFWASCSAGSRPGPSWHSRAGCVAALSWRRLCTTVLN